MCLKSVDFKMEYIADEFYGVGYKIFTHTNNSLDRMCNGFDGFQYKLNEWLEANTYLFENIPIFDDYNFIKQSYPRGFHIFTSIKDAEMYRSATERTMKIYKNKMYKVLFKDIRAFGQQELYWDYDPIMSLNNRSFPTTLCIIAGKMMIKEQIPFSWEKNDVSNQS